MPTMMPGMQGGMMPVQMTTSNKDMMSTMQGMSDLSMAMSMMKAMGVDSMMKPGKQHTMFVPNDMALQKIGMDKMNKMMKDKQMAMNIMKGHMMDSMVMPSDMTDGMMLTMMNGQTMKVSMAGGQMMIDGAKVTEGCPDNRRYDLCHRQHTLVDDEHDADGCRFDGHGAHEHVIRGT